MKSLTRMQVIAALIFVGATTAGLAQDVPNAKPKDEPPATRERGLTPAQGSAAQVEALSQRVNKLPKVLSHRIDIGAASHKFRATRTVNEEHDPAPFVLPTGTFRPWTGSIQELSVQDSKPKIPTAVHAQGASYFFNQSPPDETDQNRILSVFKAPNGWETNVASSGNVVLYTSNWLDAFSADNGKTWTTINPSAAMSDLPANPPSGAFCCDQVVQYIPQIDRFVWIAQQNAVASTKENVYRIFYASPAGLKAGNGLIWNAYDMHSHAVSPGGSFDYPEIAVGSKYLYLTADIVGGPLGGKAIMARIPLSSFGGGPTASLEPEYLLSDVFVTRPVQNVDDVGYFAALYSTSVLKIFAWGDTLQSLYQINVPISTYPTGDFSSFTPSGSNWLSPSSKYYAKLFGATKAGDQLWIAWSAARSDPFPVALSQQFPQPHIRLAIVDSKNLGVFKESAIISRDFAYAYPVLATDGDGDIGISYSYGGGTVSPHFGVGFLQIGSAGVSFQGASLWRIDAGDSLNLGAGGHYQGIRPVPGKGGCFVASGNVTVSSARLDAYYVLFGHSGPYGSHCNPLPTEVFRP
jgi:hypothetical protein